MNDKAILYKDIMLRHMKVELQIFSIAIDRQHKHIRTSKTLILIGLSESDPINHPYNQSPLLKFHIEDVYLENNSSKG